MTITLSPEVEAMVQQRIDAGEYLCAEDVVTDAIVNLKTDAGADAGELNRLVEEGIWSAQNEPLYTEEESRARLAASRAARGA